MRVHTFFKSSKNTYRLMVDGVGTKTVFHSMREIFAWAETNPGLIEVY